MPASLSVIMRMMVTAHAFLGYALLVLMITYSLGNLVAWRADLRLRALEWLFVVILLALTAQSLQGAWLLLTGHRPAEWLHLVYTAASFATFVGVRAVAIGVSATQARLVIAGGSAVATVLVARVTATG